MSCNRVRPIASSSETDVLNRLKGQVPISIILL